MASQIKMLVDAQAAATVQATSKPADAAGAVGDVVYFLFHARLNCYLFTVLPPTKTNLQNNPDIERLCCSSGAHLRWKLFTEQGAREEGEDQEEQEEAEVPYTLIVLLVLLGLLGLGRRVVPGDQVHEAHGDDERYVQP